MIKTSLTCLILLNIYNICCSQKRYFPNYSRSKLRVTNAVVLAHQQDSSGPRLGMGPGMNQFCSAVKRSIGSTTGFHNHGEGPYSGLLLVESGYYRFHI